MFGTRRVYLDHAAGVSGNPSSPHAEGRAAKRVLEAARTEIARLVEAKPDDVIFTSGATEANALAILSFAKPGTHALYLPSAHASVVENFKVLAERGVTIEPLPIRDGRVDVGALSGMLTGKTAFVSMDAVCGETGIVWNTREVRHALDAARGAVGAPRIHLHVDASQAPLTEKLSRSHFGADLLTLDASKVGPIRGIGCLIAHRTIPLVPLFGGGGQERGLRPGTESPELARAFAAALRRAAQEREGFAARAAALRAVLVERIKTSIREVYINEGPAQAPHILNFSLVGRDTDYLVALLDEAGFAVSTRSACETDSPEGSRAVFALTHDKNRAQATLRVSWGPATRERDLAHFAKALAREVVFIDTAPKR